MSIRMMASIAALAVLLAGCESNGTLALVTPGVDDQPTHTIAPTDAKAHDPKDDLGLGQLYFGEKSFGLAEKHFRLAVEKTPANAEAWLGLAASYDQLRRFDLADRAYAQVLRYSGPSPQLYNNRGFSYLMRGDAGRARRDFLAARKLAPEDVTIANNLRLLEARLAGAAR